MESTRPSVVFLHGFGGPSKVEQAFLERLRENFEAVGVTLRAPTYHPGGHVAATSLPSFLEELAAELEQHTQHAHAQSVLVGFSVGGYLVANFQERWPHLVKKAVLLAPAIDNFDRNFKDKLPEKWHMPVAYVKELQGMSARPAIKVPTMLVHGELETDQGGLGLVAHEGVGGGRGLHSLPLPQRSRALAGDRGGGAGLQRLGLLDPRGVSQGVA
ncbi:unnamed protein product [Durusdinium trenchii]|uniref:Serine aminopeptidase S33 domain-containing protein n=1 Tax=Durusdinium trenchii TaxID=1381693 RepID=A0ABP0Q1T4_9DINO